MKLPAINNPLISRLVSGNIDARIIMLLHDELLVEAKTRELDSVGEYIKSLMYESASLKVSLEFEVGVVIVERRRIGLACITLYFSG